MRPIDADKLLEHYACGDVTGIPEVDIRLAPTEDVIMIEWIEKVYCLELGGLPLSISHMIEEWRSRTTKKCQWVWRGNHYVCSKCDEWAMTRTDEDGDEIDILSNFCPNCGADMRG